jgi:hypothetical protein
MTMERTYSTEQHAYLTAKRDYQAALQVHDEALKQNDFYALLKSADDMTLVKLEVEAQQVSHLDEALDSYLRAEKALFAWGQAQSKLARRAKSHKDEAKLVATVFQNIHRYPHLKDKLAAICLALEV